MDSNKFTRWAKSAHVLAHLGSTGMTKNHLKSKKEAFRGEGKPRNEEQQNKNPMNKKSNFNPRGQ
jgi:hypothetical protein